MKSKMNIKSIVVMAAVSIISLFFINMSLAVSTGKITVETANLRETADESAKILEQLSINEEIEVIEKTGDWYKVKAKGITGFLRKDLITVNNAEQVENTNTTNQVNNETNNQTNNEETANTQNQQTEPNAENQTEQNTENKETKNKEEQNTQTDKNEELGKRKIAQNSKLKIVPVINATDIIEVKKDEEVNVIESINGWVCIEAQNTKGWLRKEKLQSKEEQQVTPIPEPQPQTVIETKYVNSESVNVRKEASKSAEVITGLTLNTAVEVLSNENGWSKVRVNGKEGYISSSLLATTKKKETTSRSSSSRKTTNTTTQTKTNTAQTNAQQANTQTQEAPPSSGSGASIVSYAKQFIGTKYTYGGSSPSTGFDCSGFTSYVYKHFGISLPRTSGGQSGVGKAVSRNNLAAGDLVIYSGHVAIYVGGGQVIHAPRPGKSVCIVPVNQAASNYLGARRVL